MRARWNADNERYRVSRIYLFNLARYNLKRQLEREGGVSLALDQCGVTGQERETIQGYFRLTKLPVLPSKGPVNPRDPKARRGASKGKLFGYTELFGIDPGVLVNSDEMNTLAHDLRVSPRVWYLELLYLSISRGVAPRSAREVFGGSLKTGDLSLRQARIICRQLAVRGESVAEIFERIWGDFLEE